MSGLEERFLHSSDVPEEDQSEINSTTKVFVKEQPETSTDNKIKLRVWETQKQAPLANEAVKVYFITSTTKPNCNQKSNVTNNEA